jgi:acetyl-CoA synthetase
VGPDEQSVPVHLEKEAGQAVTIIWRPSAEVVERANVTRFMRAHGIATEEELIRRSTSDVEWFWDAAIRDLGLEFFESYSRVLDTSRGIEWATWFGGGTVNLAHNCVDRWAERTPDAAAIVWEGEEGATTWVSYRALRERSDRLANALASLGVSALDAVGIFLPPTPEAVVAVMACSKLGAVWLPLFSGFGADAVAKRLEDAQAKSSSRPTASAPRQRRPMKETADEAVASARSVRHVVVVDRIGRRDTPWDLERDLHWDDLLAAHADRFETARLDPEHPLFIAYTSGTTGRPKGAVHVHGGFLVKIAEEVAYQTDVQPGDLLFWFADLGWIMGPWEIVGATALGATVFLFDGAPNHPGPDRLWSMVERHAITHLGVSPTLVRALIPSGEEPVRSHDLSSLRILASTGEPWNPDPYRWFFEEVGKAELPIINLSGGTEVGACFLSPHPISPLEPCTLRGPALGMVVVVFRAVGSEAGPGEVGELVCRRPWPSMTRGLRGDPERYLDAYWRRFGVWCHGDWRGYRQAPGSWPVAATTMNVASDQGRRRFEHLAWTRGDQSAVVGVPTRSRAGDLVLRRRQDAARGVW